jgi:hypothetical protein
MKELSRQWMDDEPDEAGALMRQLLVSAADIIPIPARHIENSNQ